MNAMTQAAVDDFLSPFKPRYDNFIGGTWTAPVGGACFDNITPITGAPVCEVAQSGAADVALALDAAHAAIQGWGAPSAMERGNLLLTITDRLKQNLGLLATAEPWANGKPIRETTAADIPLAIEISTISRAFCAARKAR